MICLYLFNSNPAIIPLLGKFTKSILLLDYFKDIKYKCRIIELYIFKVYSRYSYFCKDMFKLMKNFSFFLPISHHQHILIMSVSHACMGWKVSYERLPSIYVFSYVLPDIPFFQITSYCLIPCFPWSSFGTLALTLKFYI